MISELFHDLISAVRERVRTVFVGMYIMSWLVVNYRPLLVLVFSDHVIEDRYVLMDTLWPNLWVQWLVPLGVSIAILLIGVFVDYKVFLFRSKYIAKMQIARMEHLEIIASKRQNIAQHEARSERATLERRENFELKKLQLEREASHVEAHARVRELEAGNEMLRDRLDDAKVSLDRSNRLSDEAQREHDQLVMRAAQAEATNAALQDQIRNYQEDNKSLKKKLENSESEYRKIVREHDETRMTLNKRTEELRGLRNGNGE